MQDCKHEVKVYSDAEEARAFLTTTKHKIDIVVWDFHMPKVNGLEALKIGSERDLPVVNLVQNHGLGQDNDHSKTVGQGIDEEEKWTEEIQQVQSDLVQTGVLDQENYDFNTLGQGIDDKEEMWTGEIQQGQSDLVQTTDVLDLEDYNFKTIDQENYVERNIDNEEEKAAKKARLMRTSYTQPDLVQTNGLYRDNGEQNIDKKEGKKPRKPRMTWTGGLHQKFLRAIEIVGGIEKANPMLLLKCLKEMNIEGLTRNNVASHLQKHRISLEETRIPQQTLPIDLTSTAYRPSSLLGPSNDHFGQSSAYKPSSLLAPSNDHFGQSSAYKPSSLLAPSNAHSSIPYLLNDRALNPMINQNQYPNGYMAMNNNQFMKNPLPHLPSLDNHYLQPQERQPYQFSHQMDYLMNKKEPEQYQCSHHIKHQPQYQQQQYQFPHQLDYVMHKKEPEEALWPRS
ncbi:hypothetical protein AALP_AA4G069700 [Arabis alpina]|uniref:Response regulatory domain-containing protein n=1 Tax=Arabis alpina TaxID=50452 RepID=A0A087H1N5_ARAAL|nr:hypothetical protein AALP_AA4G069700 [Arabis alpina]